MFIKEKCRWFDATWFLFRFPLTPPTTPSPIHPPTPHPTPTHHPHHPNPNTPPHTPTHQPHHPPPPTNPHHPTTQPTAYVRQWIGPAFVFKKMWLKISFAKLLAVILSRLHCIALQPLVKTDKIACSPLVELYTQHVGQSPDRLQPWHYLYEFIHVFHGRRIQNNQFGYKLSFFIITSNSAHGCLVSSSYTELKSLSYHNSAEICK